MYGVKGKYVCRSCQFPMEFKEYKKLRIHLNLYHSHWSEAWLKKFGYVKTEIEKLPFNCQKDLSYIVKMQEDFMRKRVYKKDQFGIIQDDSEETNKIIE